MMRFAPVRTIGASSLAEAVDVWLPPRSVYVMTDDARYAWSHEIEGRSSDVVGGEEDFRGKRASMTLRSICSKWLPESA